MLRALVGATGERAACPVRLKRGDGWVRLCTCGVDPPQVLRDQVKAGDLLPADRGAGARILIALSPEGMRTKGRKDRELHARIRAQGYAALVGDRSVELAGSSAPVFHADGTLAGAVTLTMPTHRYDAAQIAPVREAAAKLTGQASTVPACAKAFPAFLRGQRPVCEATHTNG